MFCFLRELPGPITDSHPFLEEYMKVLPFIGAAAIALALAAPAKQGDQVAVIRGGKISIRTN